MTDERKKLDGPTDDWEHDKWVAAWGSNLPLVMSGVDLAGMPPAPAGMVWLVTRILVKGQKGAELALWRSGEGRSTLARERVSPDLDAITACARSILQRLSD